MPLQALDLSWNGLENDGCSALAAALAENHGLRNLDLSCTRMGAPACSGLGQALCQNTTIDTLLVNGNAIGEKGAQMLAQALTDARSLRHLGMQARCRNWACDLVHERARSVGLTWRSPLAQARLHACRTMPMAGVAWTRCLRQLCWTRSAHRARTR